MYSKHISVQSIFRPWYIGCLHEIEIQIFKINRLDINDQHTITAMATELQYIQTVK